MKQIIYAQKVQTDLGEFKVLATQQGLCWLGIPSMNLEDGLAWARKKMAIDKVVYEENELLSHAIKELKLYCAGKGITFSCTLDMHGTVFQKAVWQMMQRIPFGITTTYGVIAKKLGIPQASRAVGGAIGANPIPIIVPCHRVLGSGGKLVGYSEGLEIKKILLALEK